MKADLSNQVALVTGAARGIGRAMADVFLANGARVVCADLRFDPQEESTSADAARQTLLMDVSDAAQVERGMARVIERFGRLDILVNNAGINTFHHRVTIDLFPTEEWDRLIKVDLTGLYLVSKAAARVMREQGRGRIINVASVAGLVPLRLQSAFVAAKAGVVNLTKSMAMELAPYGILVNGIAPGSILTEATRQLFYGEDGQFKDSVKQLLAHIPLGRPGLPEEVAHAALFLAAPESSYINGHILVVDGGWTAGYLREF